MNAVPAPKSPPKARDAARTAETILRAAQTLFAARGYTTTGVREVAAAAGVNSALVCRYFGSKEGLLRAAVEEFLIIDVFFDGDRGDFGTRSVGLLLTAETLPNPVAMMILATADPAARILCADLLHERIIVPLAAWLGGPDGLARAGQLNLLWVGFMVARQILPTRPVHDFETATVRWLAETTQTIADGATTPENGSLPPERIAS
ncbi:TetR/AcrR family transcriptional regulator [Sphingomonas psychrolutea]|uniref:TetR family transcriptional regulator n=1 Tax=Sphingomonas psychrolutea TaxID=1259676 RepID=A0ABQ1G593_9SPHN|nr:TetR/AcrR family transcriptional regulator [Sphingomonas psychrolutea]GGA37167.1 TetR family transcriptional regulator [Sphingomonas psychrolutea]